MLKDMLLRGQNLRNVLSNMTKYVRNIQETSQNMLEDILVSLLRIQKRRIRVGWESEPISVIVL